MLHIFFFVDLWQYLNSAIMRNVFVLLFIIVLTISGLQAKQSLPDSPKNSAESIVYTIDKDNLRKNYLKGCVVSEEMLGEPVARYTNGKQIPSLKRGNYLIVNAVGNSLHFSDYTVDDLKYKMINGEKVLLCLYDSLGNIISDAVVKSGLKRIRFEPKTQTYNTSKLKNEQVLEVNNKGVYHYIEIENQHNRYNYHKRNIFQKIHYLPRKLWYSLKNFRYTLLHPEDREDKVRYTGFVVFSKPKYKPGEIVKMKAYLASEKGKPFSKPVNLRLYNNYSDNIDTVLIRNLSPYRPGMYEYQFKLTDSLKLKLDQTYRLELCPDRGFYNNVNGSFNYEDYQLKSIRLSMTSNKDTYVKGDTLKLLIKASDENDMAVYGGRAEVCLIPEKIEEQKKNVTVFVPDTLWQQTLDMKDVSEKEITLPDSIFPNNASLRYRVICTYLSADNEKKIVSKSLTRKADDYILDFSVLKGILTIQQLHNGTTQKVEANINLFAENGETVLRDTVLLPHSMPVPWYATDIFVKTSKTKYYYTLDEIKKNDQLGYVFYRQKDSVYMKVENPGHIPFWYSIRKGKKEIASGFTTSLDYSASAMGKSGFYMQMSYLFAGESKNIEQSLPYLEKNMTLEVTTPTRIYPGQKTNVQVSVADKRGKPVKDADVTAYSFTSKFDSYQMPNLSIKGKAYNAKPKEQTKYTPDESGIYNSNGKMSWNKWKSILALDTLEYYRFLYPETVYRYTEATADGSTQIVPYVVLDGSLLGIQLLWIDDVLYYTHLAQQMDVYTFSLEPGLHNIRIRTNDREIIVKNVLVEIGAKNILSFNAGKAFAKMDVDSTSMPLELITHLLNKKKNGLLSENEQNYLASQLITVDNNFGSLVLPNASTFELPAYIESGNTYYYLNQLQRNQYNNNLRAYIKSPILAGPFPVRKFMNGMSNLATVYADNDLIANIEIEGKNQYTLFKDFQKIKSWENKPFNNKLLLYTPVANFRQELLTPQRISQLFDRMVKQNLTTLSGSAILDTDKVAFKNTPSCSLELVLGRDKKNRALTPSLIYFQSDQIIDKNPCKLYYGGTRSFSNLPQGNIRINLVFSDSTIYTRNLCLKTGGNNYLNIDSIDYDSDNKTAALAFNLLDRNIRKTKTQNPYVFDPMQKNNSLQVKSSQSTYSNYNAQNGLVSGTVIDSNGEPIVGVTVIVKKTRKSTCTDVTGQFSLKADPGNILEIYYIGFSPKLIKVSKGANYSIVLKEEELFLNESVVIGYGVQEDDEVRGQDEFNGVDIADLQEHKVVAESSIKIALTGSIRGFSSIQTSQNPLIIVDGLPFNGTIQDLDPATIISMRVLNDASAVSIYGSLAANGVIFIQTKASAERAQRANTETNDGNAMRRNFHDDAFWQPRLRTDKNGKASFEVTYPDDITSWNAYFIAIGNKKQTDKKQITIKSFKALSARLSTPSFAVRGDSLNAIGRITNLLGDSISITRNIETNGKLKKDSLRIGSSYVDPIPVKAEKGDSLTVSYSLKSGNGLYDGEERTLPIIEPGMLQTFGDFKVLNDTLTHQLNVNPLLGTTNLYAEATSLDLFMREIDRVEKYPYMCNEQMASKIKALLSKKRIMELLGKEFKEEKKISGLIGKLEKNSNSEGLWGWWNSAPTEPWISNQALSALMDAEDAGYKIHLDKKTLAQTTEYKIKEALNLLKIANKNQLIFAKQQLLDNLMLLKRLNPQLDAKIYFKSIDYQLKSKSLTDKIKTMQAMSVVGFQDELNADSLMKYAGKTLLGSLYWGETEMNSNNFRRSFLPYASNIENTLMAYRIFKNIGGHEQELEKIRNYFFENHAKGTWQNTYESSRIIETILPDMLKKNEDYNNARILVNGKTITRFPYVEQIETTTPISIKNEGTMPLFVTAYQQTWNKNPEAETQKGITIKTSFTSDGKTIAHLKEGKTAQMEVLVNVNAEANYVQIEIPIPAGCSYEDKTEGLFRDEAHREHFKNKVVVFCNKLSPGEHTFFINLLPRYTGKYTINPAKTELMYFPTYYGNEGIKNIEIR